MVFFFLCLEESVFLLNLLPLPPLPRPLPLNRPVIVLVISSMSTTHLLTVRADSLFFYYPIITVNDKYYSVLCLSSMLLNCVTIRSLVECRLSVIDMMSTTRCARQCIPLDLSCRYRAICKGCWSTSIWATPGCFYTYYCVQIMYSNYFMVYYLVC